MRMRSEVEDKARETPRIEVLLKGGLGNQLFGWAAGKNLAKQLQLPLHLVTSGYKTKRGKRKLEIQALLAENETTGDVSVVSKIFKEQSFSFDSRFREISGPILLDGYFQSSKYFTDVSEQLVMRLRAMQPSRNHNRHPFIGVHFRRGDYASPSVASFHGLLPDSYFVSGVNQLREGLGNLPVVVFSDDNKEATRLAELIPNASAKKLLRWQKPVHVMAALSEAVGLCISNSSFGWWAAFSSTASQVITPFPWFNEGPSDTHDLYEPDWVQLKYSRG